MASKAVRLGRKAEKELARLFRGDRVLYARIKQELLDLQHNYSKGKPLVGDKKGCYRLRVGDYRIIYEVTGDEVWIIKIGHRKEVYR